MIKTREISLTVQEEDTKKSPPTITKWNNESMIRIHSLRASVKEIIQVSQVLDVVKIGIIGDPGSGKTTLAMDIAHLIHKMSEYPFAVRVFGEEEFLHLKETLAAMEPVNYIIYFHDLSFLTDKRAIEEVKNAITKIRHLKKDVKIILIYDYHYLLGLDKYLRQSNFRYMTSLGTSETDNVIKIVGSQYSERVKDFQEKYVEMTTKHKCTFRIAPNKYFIYNYKNPFIPCLFYNGRSLRYIVFPLREWIDKICSICSMANKTLIHSEIPVDQFIKETEAKFGPGVFEATVKLRLFQNGMNTYARSVTNCGKYLDRALEKKMISLEELATKKGLTITRTKLRKKLDGVLSEQAEPEKPLIEEDKALI